MDDVPTLSQYVADLERADEDRGAKRRKKQEEAKAKQLAHEEEILARKAEEVATAKREAAAVSLNAPAPSAPAPSALAANAPRGFATPAPVAQHEVEQISEPCLEGWKDGKRVEKHVLSSEKDNWVLG